MLAPLVSLLKHEEPAYCLLTGPIVFLLIVAVALLLVMQHANGRSGQVSYARERCEANRFRVELISVLRHVESAASGTVSHYRERMPPGSAWRRGSWTWKRRCPSCSKGRRWGLAGAMSRRTSAAKARLRGRSRWNSAWAG